MKRFKMNRLIARLVALLLLASSSGVMKTMQGQSASSSARHQTGARLESKVQKPARPLPGNPQPRYPSVLQRAGISGQVRAEFVVDTAGIPDTASFKLLTASHPLFAAAVKAALPAMRFSPAELGGRKVKQLVRMPFKFTPP